MGAIAGLAYRYLHPRQTRMFPTMKVRVNGLSFVAGEHDTNAGGRDGTWVGVVPTERLVHDCNRL